MNLSILDAILLGMVQGLTEFLPVSSSGHLAVGQMWLGLKEGNLLLSVTLHAGTLIATMLFFRDRLQRIVSDCLPRGEPLQVMARRSGVQDAVTVLLASLPTAIIGLAFKDTVEQWTRDPFAVAIGFLITSLVLLSTLFAMQRQARSSLLTDVPTRVGALAVGVAQAIAIAPGVSRSGMTIAVLLWLGVRPFRSFELSMLISLPAVFGAFLLEARHLSEGSTAQLEVLVGAIVSFVVGLIALRVLRGLVTQGRFAWFTLWVFPMAVLLFLSG